MKIIHSDVISSIVGAHFDQNLGGKKPARRTLRLYKNVSFYRVAMLASSSSHSITLCVDLDSMLYFSNVITLLY